MSVPFTSPIGAVDRHLLPPTTPCGTLTGTVIDPMNSTDNWDIGWGGGASPPVISIVPGYTGSALKMDYNLGSIKGGYVQIIQEFDTPQDWSGRDHLRFYYTGTAKNTLQIGLVYITGDPPNYFGTDFTGVTHIPWWTYATWDFKDFLKGDVQPFPDFHQVKGIFISVANIATGDVGGTGSIIIDELQIANLASRVPGSFETFNASPSVVSRAAAWIGRQQKASGLLKSWYEETVDYAWLYDQALGLLVLSETDLLRARKLADRLHHLQNDDGSWYFGYFSTTNVRIDEQKDIGAVAWLAYALTRYSARESNVEAADRARQDAYEAAVWLAQQQKPDGSLEASTELNLDSWWTFQSAGCAVEADKLRDYLLNDVWDTGTGRFKSTSSAYPYRNYQIFLDNQTWGAPFLRAVGRMADVHRALSYARETLLTTSSTGNTCGFDGAGPFSVWNEGVSQYIAQRGAGSAYYWNQMVKQQAAGGPLDGSMPGSPDDFAGYTVWLTRWHGIAPTAWLYFAGKGGPYVMPSPAPAKIRPARNYYTTHTPVLSWSRITIARNYEVQVNSRSTFSGESIFAATPDAQTLSVQTTPLSNGTYYWRVRATKADGMPSGWSLQDSFVVEASSCS
jgi:hypothetical protein